MKMVFRPFCFSIWFIFSLHGFSNNSDNFLCEGSEELSTPLEANSTYGEIDEVKLNLVFGLLKRLNVERLIEDES